MLIRIQALTSVAIEPARPMNPDACSLRPLSLGNSAIFGRGWSVFDAEFRRCRSYLHGRIDPEIKIASTQHPETGSNTYHAYLMPCASPTAQETLLSLRPLALSYHTRETVEWRGVNMLAMVRRYDMGYGLGLHARYDEQYGADSGSSQPDSGATTDRIIIGVVVGGVATIASQSTTPVYAVPADAGPSHRRNLFLPF